MRNRFRRLSLLVIVSLLLSGCAGANAIPDAGGDGNTTVSTGTVIEYAFTSRLENGQMQFVGDGGDIDGKVNPPLTANTGETVRVTLTSGEGVEHNISFPDSA